MSKPMVLACCLAGLLAGCAGHEAEPISHVQLPLPKVKRIPGNYEALNQPSYREGWRPTDAAGAVPTPSSPSSAPATSNSDPHYTCRMGSGGEVERKCRRDGYL